MADSHTGEISWYSPDPRTIFDLNEFHIPRSLRLTLKKEDCEVHVNKRFEEVIRACAEREETWISETIIQSYCKLHQLGLAHSVEILPADSMVLQFRERFSANRCSVGHAEVRRLRSYFL